MRIHFVILFLLVSSLGFTQGSGICQKKTDPGAFVPDSLSCWRWKNIASNVEWCYNGITWNSCQDTIHFLNADLTANDTDDFLDHNFNNHFMAWSNIMGWEIGQAGEDWYWFPENNWETGFLEISFNVTDDFRISAGEIEFNTDSVLVHIDGGVHEESMPDYIITGNLTGNAGIGLDRLTLKRTLASDLFLLQPDSLLPLGISDQNLAEDRTIGLNGHSLFLSDPNSANLFEWWNDYNNPRNIGISPNEMYAGIRFSDDEEGCQNYIGLDDGPTFSILGSCGVNIGNQNSTIGIGGLINFNSDAGDYSIGDPLNPSSFPPISNNSVNVGLPYAIGLNSSGDFFRLETDILKDPIDSSFISNDSVFIAQGSNNFFTGRNSAGANSLAIDTVEFITNETFVIGNKPIYGKTFDFSNGYANNDILLSSIENVVRAEGAVSNTDFTNNRPFPVFDYFFATSYSIEIFFELNAASDVVLKTSKVTDGGFLTIYYTKL